MFLKMNSSYWNMILLATTIWLLAIGGQLTAGWSFLKQSDKVENSNNSAQNVGMSQVAQDGASGEIPAENAEGPEAAVAVAAPAPAPDIPLMKKPAIKFSIYGVVALIILGLGGTGLSYYKGWVSFASNAIATTLDPLLNQNITDTNSTTTTVPPSIDMSNILLLSAVSLSLVGVGIFLYRRNLNKNDNKKLPKKVGKTRATKTSDPGSNATGEGDLKNSDNPDNDNDMDGDGEEGGDPQTNLKSNLKTDLKNAAQSKVSINSKMSNIGDGASKIGGAGVDQSNYEKDDPKQPKPPGTSRISSGFGISKNNSQFQQQQQPEPISKYNRQTQRNTKKPPPLDGAGGGQQYAKMMPTVSMLMMMNQGSPENIPEVPAKKGGRGGGGGGGDPRKGGKKTGKNAYVKKPMKKSPGRKPGKRAR